VYRHQNKASAYNEAKTEAETMKIYFVKLPKFIRAKLLGAGKKEAK